jgi:dynein heavy chain
LQHDRLTGKCVYFVRTNPKGILEKTYDSDMAVGDITGNALDTFRALVSDLYLPIFQEQQSWGKMPQDHTKEFLSGASKFSTVLTEAASCLDGGIELKKPDDRFCHQYDLRPGSFNAAGADPDASKNLEDCLNEWCRQVMWASLPVSPRRSELK